MRYKYKNKIKTKIAAVIATLTLLVNGGITIVITILGGTLQPHKTNDSTNVKPESNEKKYQIEMNNDMNSMKIISKQITNKSDDKNNCQYNHEKDLSLVSFEEYLKANFLYEIETTEAISQEENINRLVRKRRKETVEKVKNS